MVAENLSIIPILLGVWTIIRSVLDLPDKTNIQFDPKTLKTIQLIIDGKIMTTFKLGVIIASTTALLALCETSQAQVPPIVAAESTNYFQEGQTSPSDIYQETGGCNCQGTSNILSNGEGSCESCGGCETGNCGRGRLFGGSRLGRNLLSRIQPSEQCFDGFISPITNPIYFEDPRALTEIRPLFVSHQVPGALGGGTVNLYAMQVRARLSENVSFIAIKDGFFTSTSPVLADGWADVGAGLKFNLLRDVENQRLWSAGFTYEAPVGSAAALQGLGSGDLHLFSSAARRIGERGFFMSAGGARLPFNASQGSTSLYNSFHYSHLMTRRFYLLTELNWFRWIGSGDNPIGIEGVDIANLGSAGVTGNNIVTWAYGMRFKPNRRNELGCAYEIPVSGRRDIMGNRVTADWIIRY